MSIKQTHMSITQKHMSITQRHKSITQRHMSITQKHKSITQKHTSIMLKHMSKRNTGQANKNTCQSKRTHQNSLNYVMFTFSPEPSDDFVSVRGVASIHCGEVPLTARGVYLLWIRPLFNKEKKDLKILWTLRPKSDIAHMDVTV